MGGGRQSLRSRPECPLASTEHDRCRNGQLLGARFRRQAVIGRYIADFACFAPKLVIELDGGQHAEQAVYDEARTRWLVAEGFVVLRFWNNDVLSNLDGIVESIAAALGNGSRPPP